MLEHLFRGKKWVYYTREEADSLGIGYLGDWRSVVADIDGQYLLSEDGWVVPVIWCRVASVFPKYRDFQVATGRFLTSPGSSFTSEMRENRWSYSGKRPECSNPDRALTRKERAFVAHYTSSWDLIEAFKFATDSDPSLPNFRRSASNYLGKRANVAKAVERRISEIFSDLGMTREWVGENLRDIVSGAGESTRDRLRALEVVGKMLGMLEKGRKDSPQNVLAITATEIKLLENERREMIEGGEDGEMVEGVGGQAGGSPEDVSGHGSLREVDVPASLVQEDP